MNLNLITSLYMRFTSIYGEKFTKNHPDKNFINIWIEDWTEGLEGIEPDQVKEALKECRFNLEWPPSLAEFRKLCEKVSGIPSMDEVMQLAIRRDLSHPIVDMVYKKIGSWDFSHDKQDVLQRKVRTAYKEAIDSLRNKQLESKQQKPKLEALTNDSHGSEVTRNQPRSGSMRNASEYLFSGGSMG